MNRTAFFSNNKTTEEFDYQTNINSATTSNVIFTLPGSNIKKRIHYDPDYTGFNFYIEPNFESGLPLFTYQRIQFTYSGDPGTLKTVKVKSNDFSKVVFLNASNQKINGNVNLSNFIGLNQIYLGGNPNLTGVTLPYLNNVAHYNLSSCNITGVHDLRTVNNMGSFFFMNNNPNLTKVLHTGSTSGWVQYELNNNINLSGNHDMSGFVGSSGSGSFFFVYSNPSLTGITHGPTLQPISLYYTYLCNLTGNHDVSMLSGLTGTVEISFNPNLTNVTFGPNTIGTYAATFCNLTGNQDLTKLTSCGSFLLWNNPNLTGLTHNSTSSQLINNYRVFNSNLTGTHDVSMLSGLGGNFQLNNNPNLTNIINPSNSNIFSNYQVNNCNLTGNYDLSTLSGLSSTFNLNNNSGLTSVTHTLTTNNISNYSITNCNLTGTHNISMLNNLSGVLYLNNNSNLTNIVLPTLTGGTFNKKVLNSISIDMSNCNLDYIDFWPLSSSTMSGSSISLTNNNMSASDVNHILVDFDNISTLNQPYWSGVTLDIGGTNDPPDSSSGGYDGITAINNLTSSPRNWFITY